jgi:hypothetical protein
MAACATEQKKQAAIPTNAQQFGKSLARYCIRSGRRDQCVADSSGISRSEGCEGQRAHDCAHRVGGYLFIAVFCVMAFFMVARLGDVGAGGSPGTTIHMTLAMVLSRLLPVKVLVARYYKNYSSLLMPFGLVIFVLSFVLIGITAGPSLAHHAGMQMVSLDTIDPTARSH